MFGSLFDDERPVGVMTNVHTLAVPRPPNRRLLCGLSGIENQGATCYLNSLLQTLLYTPEFREGLFHLSEVELGSLENRDKKEKIRIIPLQLQRLFVKLLLVDQQAASTTELTDSFGWTNNEELQQHDVQELNRILFSAIDSSLVGTTGKDLISKLYHGSTISEIVCQICGKISEREEDFLDLNVIVANYSNLQDSLNATFLQQEIMKGKNQYRCSTCCNLVDAKKGSKIQCLPLILTFSLLRFSYDISKAERYKETGKFVFPFEIDMASYCNKEMKPDDSTYELFSVVIHSGCSYGGHYHAYIRDVDGLGKWFPPEDESFTLIGESNKDVIDAIQDPISLLKAILSEKEDNCLPIDILCGEITKWTGVSWNKRFKSMHGVIAKFLEKHNEVFLYNSDTNMVYLKNESATPEHAMECSSSVPNNLENASGSPKETKKYAVMNSLKLNLFDKKRTQNSQSAYSHNWFDFNDAKVSPILVKDIEKQYSGKESAYMLFYRRKSLIRPPEAKGNPKYGIPEKLLKFADEENLKLERLRDEYETALNTVNLQVHLGNNYKCSNGVLEPKPNEVVCLDLAVDKRKLLLDLRDAISKLCAELYPTHDFVLHTAQEVPAGLHLYEELSESQNLETLKDLGILEGTKIFVWDGCQVGGEHFAIGVAHEPILLNISVTLPNGETSEMSQGFPKTTTVGELKIFISTSAPLPLEDLRVCRQDLQGEDSKLSPLTEKHDGLTLSELSFIDGDNIFAESVKCEQMQTKEAKTFVSVIVQNCCNSMNTDDSDFQLIELTVDVESSVEQLKNMAISDLNLDEKQSYVFRKLVKNHGKKPPLHEHQTVKEAGLVENSCLTVEEGIPPSPEQITIMFTVGVGIGDGPDFEITINKNASAHECLKKMLSMAGLSGDCWHLRKTNWCGEPMEQISLDGSTLENEGVQHGDDLIIMEGRLPPKGFLIFSIILFPTIEKIQNPTNVLNMNGIYGDIENLLQTFGEAMAIGDINNGVKIGEVELSNESTVGDLKKYVLTLPSLSNLSLPNIRYLRLRLLDNGRPGRVLRGLSNSLKKLKIQSHNSLAAQILFQEEDLMQTDLLLLICQRIPDTKSYTPPLELTWDAGKSASPKNLKQTIADSMAYPVHRIVIAKKFPERCQWLVIDDGTNPKKGNKKKRWGVGKSNLRHSPYFLKDGDIIGVKDRLSDPDDTDDFLTADDIEGQEILKIAAENKRIKRHEDKSPSRCSEWMLGGSDRELPRHAKKSEVGITIHVDDFT